MCSRLPSTGETAPGWGGGGGAAFSPTDVLDVGHSGMELSRVPKPPSPEPLRTGIRFWSKYDLAPTLVKMEAMFLCCPHIQILNTPAS